MRFYLSIYLYIHLSSTTAGFSHVIIVVHVVVVQELRGRVRTTHVRLFLLINVPGLVVWRTRTKRSMPTINEDGRLRVSRSILHGDSCTGMLASQHQPLGARADQLLWRCRRRSAEDVQILILRLLLGGNRTSAAVIPALLSWYVALSSLWATFGRQSLSSLWYFGSSSTSHASTIDWVPVCARSVAGTPASQRRCGGR